jgi:hypothetical protein
LQQRRLARTDLTGEDHETVGQPDRRLHVSLGARVLLAPIEIVGIRREPKWLIFQIEMT